MNIERRRTHHPLINQEGPLNGLSQSVAASERSEARRREEQQKIMPSQARWITGREMHHRSPVTGFDVFPRAIFGRAAAEISERAGRAVARRIAEISRWAS